MKTERCSALARFFFKRVVLAFDGRLYLYIHYKEEQYENLPI